MDSFMDNTEVLRMKRNYNRFLMEDETTTFGNTRHNLLPDFEETPVKSMKLAANTSVGKRLYPNVSSSISSHDTSDLRKQLTTRDIDINVLKASITQLESRLSSNETTSREARIEYDKEIMKLKSEKDRGAAKVAEMRSKLAYVMEKEMHSGEEILKLTKDLYRQKEEFDKKLLALEKEKLEATNRAQETKSVSLEKEAELHSQIMSQMKEISDLHIELGEAQAQLDLRKQLQSESIEQRKDTEKLSADLQEMIQKNKLLEQRLSEHEDNLLITRALKSDLDLVPSMKSELEQLRLDNEQLRYNEQNTLLLEEEVRSLKSKLEHLTSAHERLTQLEVENEELQERLQRWEATDTSGSRRPQSPCSLSRRIQELELIQASTMLSQGELQTNLNSTQRKLDQASSESRKHLAGLAEEKRAVSQCRDQIKHLQRKLLLVTRERDSNRGLLESYENEVTINFDAEKRAQIERLEAILQGYKEQNTELETEIKVLTEKLGQTQAQCSQLRLQLETTSQSVQETPSTEDKELIIQLREKVSQLEASLAETQQQRDILEARIEQRHLQGDYDPSKTKVVHLSMNPCSVAQAARSEELDKLREENEKLRKRNQILEESGGQVQDLTIQVQEKMQHPSPSKEVEEMKVELQREKMRNQRLMEVFKKTSHEFREVCYQLTGYKIDIPCSNQYRLTSMYAEGPRDCFLFQQNPQGEIQMLKTDFSMTVQESMELYLQTHNSIPMFLSHITMELFSRQTMNLG